MDVTQVSRFCATLALKKLSNIGYIAKPFSGPMGPKAARIGARSYFFAASEGESPTERVLLIVVCLSVLLPNLVNTAFGQSAVITERTRACYESDLQFRELYEAGQRAVRHETSMKEAPALFRLAYWSCPSASAQLSEALALISLGQYMHAHAVLQPLTGSPNRGVRDEARELLAGLDATMDNQRFGHLTLRYSPATAEVLIDNTPVPSNNGLLLWRLSPGVHQVVLRADFYTPAVLSITVGDVEQLSREVVLQHLTERL